MRCNKIKKLLSGYSDNSLDITVKDEVKKHLDECSDCADYFKNMAKIDNLIKLKIKEKPSKEYFAGYWDRLKNELEESVNLYPDESRQLLNFALPRLAVIFNGVLLATLIFLSGLFYTYTQRLQSLEFVQEETQKILYRHLSDLRAKVSLSAESFQIERPDIEISEAHYIFQPVDFTNDINVKGNMLKLDRIEELQL